MTKILTTLPLQLMTYDYIIFTILLYNSLHYYVQWTRFRFLHSRIGNDTAQITTQTDLTIPPHAVLRYNVVRMYNIADSDDEGSENGELDGESGGENESQDYAFAQTALEYITELRRMQDDLDDERRVLQEQEGEFQDSKELVRDCLGHPFGQTLTRMARFSRENPGAHLSEKFPDTLSHACARNFLKKLLLLSHISTSLIMRISPLLLLAIHSIV